jgi:hypothetical protein
MKWAYHIWEYWLKDPGNFEMKLSRNFRGGLLSSLFQWCESTARILGSIRLKIARKRMLVAVISIVIYYR